VSASAVPAAPRSGWWLVPEAAVLVVLVLLAFAAAPVGGTNRAVGELAARVIENSPPAEHHEHGHDVTAANRIFCGVDVFGTEPPGAAPEEVRVVYGYYFCAVGSPGRPYRESSRSDGPVVIRPGGAPAVTIARSGAGYADRVRAMMPDEYEQWCFGGLRDDAVAGEVRRRYEAELGA
jgi:hypothetical protein